ncbi:MAG TPA: squalene/phytoene synthase family protein [Rhodospirillales bacterium]|jgi:phytoene/squalene synthetase|nr:squalene/phytoene synthase family protein [Rhodospirillales bacterium]HJO69135.1 squalene/phytoene synthase family protein [Rhodospirillales bacterium]
MVTTRDRREAYRTFAPPLDSALGWRLVDADVRAGVATFSDFVERAFAIAFDQAASPDERRNVLSHLDETMRVGSAGQRGTRAVDASADAERVASTRRILDDDSLSLDLAAHVLQAAMKTALGIRIQNWSELLLYCRYAAHPKAQVLLALAGETDERARHAANALVSAGFIVHSVLNFRRDFGVSGRLLLPEDWFRQEGIAPEVLARPEPSPAAQAVLGHAASGVHRLLADARPLARVIRNRGLRAELVSSACLTAHIASHFRDPRALAAEARPSAFTRGRCAAFGLVRGFLVNR